MAAKDGETVAPRGDIKAAYSELLRSQRNDGKSNATPSTLPTSNSVGFLNAIKSPTYPPPTPAFGQASFGKLEDLSENREERPTPARNSSFAKTSASEGEHPPVKRMKLDFTDILRIDVGPQRHGFYVPRKLATSRSPLLATNFKEGQPILLPGEEAQVFSIWLQVILQGQVVIDDEENAMDKAQMWSLLVQTYVLAAKLGDAQSMNVTMDEIVRRLRYRPFSGEEPIAQAVKYTFEHTPPDSKLRRVFIDFAVYRASDRNLFSEAGSNDFLSEVVKEYMNWRDMQPQVPTAFGGGRRGKFGEDARQYHVKDSPGVAVKR
ncbi:hypothetical protein M409DRAFT_54467 [Zasmidium cellare ATCC 36951]|uniref:BTB domain-containing protein n=1 Tax=Zasmidium cellare ATCC 36951 TaxID=1080233 RepID=A0A6A6CP87_ZASCE|nr:uncharacterized protein M409DRAFT_54467 [Zasmidium cellare ATCC 36951]KAF2167296.1 hypothetical protein M409DRAFT_54467 [Zasmidium cellare ATCC 36951]